MQLRYVNQLTWPACAKAWEKAFPEHEITQNAIQQMCLQNVTTKRLREQLGGTKEQSERQTILNTWLQSRRIQSRVMEKVDEAQSA